MEAHAVSGDPSVTDVGVGVGLNNSTNSGLEGGPIVGPAAGSSGLGMASAGGGEYDPAAYKPLDLAAPTPLHQNNGQPQHDLHAQHLHTNHQLSDSHLHQQSQGLVGSLPEQYQDHQQQMQQHLLQHHSQQQSLQQSQPQTHQQLHSDGGVAYQSQQAQTSYKVFCGGLSFQTDEDKLREYFERLGTVVDVVIMRDRMSGHPRGFGFVSFAEESVAKDVASRRHDIDGRQVEAKIAIPRNQVPPAASTGAVRNGAPRHGFSDSSGLVGASSGAPMGSAQGGSRSNSSHLNKIFVGGLPSQVGEAEFSAYFSQFGEVVDAQVMIDHQTGNSRGFGFISFADQSSVEAVVGPGRSNTRHEIMGKTVEVKRAEPKGTTGERRTRDSYSAGQRSQYGGSSQGVSGMGGGNPPSAAAATPAAGVPAAATATAGTYAGYNYPASIMEQYGAYYNNPQWQQYYAAMGYNMSAYPQGFNPYTYYAAYMNNAAAAGASGATGGESDGGAAGASAASDGAGLVGHGSDGQSRGAFSPGAGNGTASGLSNASGGAGAGSSGSGPGSRRTSRRDDRYHPYR